MSERLRQRGKSSNCLEETGGGNQVCLGERESGTLRTARGLRRDVWSRSWGRS